MKQKGKMLGERTSRSPNWAARFLSQKSTCIMHNIIYYLYEFECICDDAMVLPVGRVHSAFITYEITIIVHPKQMDRPKILSSTKNRKYLNNR